MRRLFFLVVIAALAWSGYWFVGSTAKREAIAGWLSAQQSRGWIAEADEIAVQGYPNRFDTTLSGLELADPASDVAWSAPSFRIYALSYAPNHIIASWPQSQTVSGPFGALRIDSREMTGSVRFQPSTSLALDETRIEMRGVDISAAEGWSTGLGEGRFALRADPTAEIPNTYEVFLRGSVLEIPEALRDRLDPEENLPPSIGAIELRGRMTLDAPLDRHAAEGAPPSVMAIEIDEASLGWGDLRLAADGRLEADANGYAEGRVAFRAGNWREQLRRARNSGLLTPEADAWANRLLSATQQSGEEDLNLTLAYRKGRMWMGPIPVGPAPRLNDGVPNPS
ncbi:DUF2125 domain-containing protein [Halovulum sp. GXIMD14794]